MAGQLQRVRMVALKDFDAIEGSIKKGNPFYTFNDRIAMFEQRGLARLPEKGELEEFVSDKSKEEPVADKKDMGNAYEDKSAHPHHNKGGKGGRK